MAKAADLQAAKERKQKKIAAVGGVLLVIVLFVQVPRTMRMLNDGAEEPAPVAAPVAAETPAAAAPVQATVPDDGVVTASLVSFSRFTSKDPFVQQVEEKQPRADAAAPAPAKGPTADPPAAEAGDGSVAGEAPSPPAVRSKADLVVNGTPESVSVGGLFPAANPTFELVSVGAKSAVIKVADDGGFESGSTLTLKLGQPVTLVNTADGTRFSIVLKAVS